MGSDLEILLSWARSSSLTFDDTLAQHLGAVNGFEVQEVRIEELSNTIKDPW